MPVPGWSACTRAAGANATATSSSVTAGSKLYRTGGTLFVTFNGSTGASGKIVIRAIMTDSR